MEFLQKKLFFDKAHFRFGEKQLEYTFTDETRIAQFSVFYVDIDDKKSIERFAGSALRRLGRSLLLSAFIGFLFAIATTKGNMDSAFLTVMFLGLALCAFILIAADKRFMRFDGTKIAAGYGNNILIIHDDQHQAILDEIYGRKKAMLRKLYAEVDFLNHPEAELKKLLWLKDSGIISEQEFHDGRQKISSAMPATPQAQAQAF